MSVRAGSLTAEVVEKVVLSDHLIRLRLAAPGFVSTGVPDEWVALTVPGQFQSRYYTVRSAIDGLVTLDVVIHAQGLVTQWAQTDCEGEQVTITEPKGSYTPPADAAWVVAVGDLTGLPAIARICEVESRAVLAHVEAPPGTAAAYPDLHNPSVTWYADETPGAIAGESQISRIVETISWPDGPGYFWMAGESAQMREVRRWARREGRFDAKHMCAMGYWSGARGRQTRALDPRPVYARGLAQGKSADQIWIDYDQEAP